MLLAISRNGIEVAGERQIELSPSESRSRGEQEAALRRLVAAVRRFFGVQKATMWDLNGMRQRSSADTDSNLREFYKKIFC